GQSPRDRRMLLSGWPRNTDLGSWRSQDRSDLGSAGTTRGEVMSRIRIFVALALAAAVTLAIPTQPASAAPLGFTQMTIDGEDRIYSVDMGTGDTTFIGDTGLEPPTTSLAFAPDGTLFGI